MPATKEASARQLLRYDTFKDSRAHLADVIDTAQDGLLVHLHRGGSNRERRAGSVAVMKTTVLRDILEHLVADAVVVEHDSDEQLYTVAIDGLPLAAEGESISDAFAELVDDIRDYCDDWVDRLRFAPNHAGNLPVVFLAQTMSDDELHEWLKKQAGE